MFEIESVKINGNLNLLNDRKLEGAANISIDVRASFSEDRGAFLIMYRPRTTILPRHTLLEKLAGIQSFRERKHICLVTKVFSCPAYAMQLCDAGE